MKRNFQEHVLAKVLVTLAAIAAYRIVIHIPMPYVSSGLNGFSGNGMWERGPGSAFFESFSIAALGLMPYVSASILIEIGSLFLPFLQRHRAGEYRGRVVLRRYSLAVTLILAAVQGWFIIDGLKSMISPSRTPLLTLDGSLQFVVLLSSLVAAVFVILLLADMVTKYGVGNGISVLIFAGIALDTFQNLVEFFRGTGQVDGNFFHFLLFFTIGCLGFIGVPILLVRAYRSVPLVHCSDTHATAFCSLNGCLSGRQAVSLAASLIMLPATFFAFMESGGLPVNMMQSGTIAHGILSCVFIFLFSYLLGWVFLHPQRRFARMEKWGWERRDGAEPLFKALAILNLPWTLFLCAIAILPSLLVSGFDAPMYLGGASLFMTAFIGLDIIADLRFSSTGGLGRRCVVAEVHDVHYAAMIQNHLQSENITCFLQGYYHRHLLYFFGPYIPIRLIVPAAERYQVEEIIKRYYGGLGL